MYRCVAATLAGLLTLTAAASAQALIPIYEGTIQLQTVVQGLYATPVAPLESRRYAMAEHDGKLFLQGFYGGLSYLSANNQIVPVDANEPFPHYLHSKLASHGGYLYAALSPFADGRADIYRTSGTNLELVYDCSTEIVVPNTPQVCFIAGAAEFQGQLYLLMVEKAFNYSDEGRARVFRVVGNGLVPVTAINNHPAFNPAGHPWAVEKHREGVPLVATSWGLFVEAMSYDGSRRLLAFDGTSATEVAVLSTSAVPWAGRRIDLFADASSVYYVSSRLASQGPPHRAFALAPGFAPVELGPIGSPSQLSPLPTDVAGEGAHVAFATESDLWVSSSGAAPVKVNASPPTLPRDLLEPYALGSRSGLLFSRGSIYRPAGLEGTSLAAVGQTSDLATAGQQMGSRFYFVEEMGVTPQLRELRNGTYTQSRSVDVFSFVLVPAFELPIGWDVTRPLSTLVVTYALDARGRSTLVDRRAVEGLLMDRPARLELLRMTRGRGGRAPATGLVSVMYARTNGQPVAWAVWSEAEDERVAEMAAPLVERSLEAAVEGSVEPVEGMTVVSPSAERQGPGGARR